MSKARITNVDINWQRIKSACMTTISKQAGDKEPPKSWKQKLLICRHSPIRRGNVSWKWDEIPYAISTHFVRHHEGCEKFVGTSREDRTNIPRNQRSQMDNVMMEMDANLQALLNISERRLCMCADPTTRSMWEEFLDELREVDEDVYWANVPQCIRCGACVEPFGECKYFENFAKTLTKEELIDMKTRLDKYNEYRDAHRKVRRK